MARRLARRLAWKFFVVFRWTGGTNSCEAGRQGGRPAGQLAALRRPGFCGQWPTHQTPAGWHAVEFAGKVYCWPVLDKVCSRMRCRSTNLALVTVSECVRDGNFQAARQGKGDA